MGTNFYINSKKFDDVSGHIGKRSAAGYYCWDCHLTLCAEGPGKVHYGCRKSRPLEVVTNKEFCSPGSCDGGHWFEECPACGAKPKFEDLNNSTVGRELGFNSEKPVKKTGVASCCSFTWGIKRHDFIENVKKLKLKNPVIDEYGRKFTLDDFLSVLEECPIQSFGMIGTDFS